MSEAAMKGRWKEAIGSRGGGQEAGWVGRLGVDFVAACSLGRISRIRFNFNCGGSSARRETSPGETMLLQVQICPKFAATLAGKRSARAREPASAEFADRAWRNPRHNPMSRACPNRSKLCHQGSVAPWPRSGNTGAHLQAA